MPAKFYQINPGSQCEFAYKVYGIATCFLLESILQWLFFIYMDLTADQFVNEPTCFVMLLSSLVIITLNRFIDAIKDSMPCVLYFIFNLFMVELAIIGAGLIITSAAGQELIFSILILLFMVFIFSFVGGYMKITNTTIFVACLCIWLFVCVLGVLLLLTVLLLVEFKITYVNVFAAMLYPTVLFMIAYDARFINSISVSMNLKDCLSSALTIYGQFILLLITTLNLTKQQSEYW